MSNKKEWICCDTGKKIDRVEAGCNHDRCTGPTPVAPHNGGQWTEARKKGFIVSLLRAGFQRWGPKQQCIKDARVGRGKYKCSSCGTVGPPTLPPKPGNKRRVKNIVADHIEPIVDPDVGFVGFDEWVARAFVEIEAFQALCDECHTIKTKKERDVATERRRNERV